METENERNTDSRTEKCSILKNCLNEINSKSLVRNRVQEMVNV